MDVIKDDLHGLTVYKVWAIESEEQLTTLPAKYGDLAGMRETVNGNEVISKTWRCLGDPSERKNWVRRGEMTAEGFRFRQYPLCQVCPTTQGN